MNNASEIEQMVDFFKNRRETYNKIYETSYADLKDFSSISIAVLAMLVSIELAFFKDPTLTLAIIIILGAFYIGYILIQRKERNTYLEQIGNLDAIITHLTAMKFHCAEIDLQEIKGKINNYYRDFRAVFIKNYDNIWLEECLIILENKKTDPCDRRRFFQKR